jgi:ELWxxDGT repeat protein
MRLASFRQWLGPRFGGPKTGCFFRKVLVPLPLCLELLEDRLLPSLRPVLLPPINPHTLDSNPGFFTEFKGLVFFSANDGIHGTELWESNGSAAGTFLVKDFNPGVYGSYSPSTNVNGTLFFPAGDGTGGVALWKSDGTIAGTTIVRDTVDSKFLTNVNGTLFFQAMGELWKSDGTRAGTVVVKNIRAGSDSASPDTLTNVNGTLFFGADDGVNGTELWRSNGMGAGTVLVKDINPGPQTFLLDPVNVNGTLFFSANDGTHGTELWESNGTAVGTFLVRDINPGASNSYPNYLTNVNGTLFFSADDGTHGRELWKSNGTAAGTLLMRDLNPGPGGSYLGDLTNMSGTLFFSAEDGTHGKVLWESNGSAAGTFVVKDVSVDPNFAYGFANVNGTLFFQADDGTHGRELWESNGASAGTFLVKDINRGEMFPDPRFSLPSLTNVNGTLFFSADDGVHGRELWKSNGASAGTALVKDINQVEVGSKPTDIVAVGATAFFSANDGSHGAQLWESNGTPAGTHMLTDVRNGSYGSYPSNLTNVNGTLFFSDRDGTHGSELWRSNGSAAGTYVVKSGQLGAPGYLTNVNGTLFFGAYGGNHGFELWESNGTDAGTFVVKDIRPDSGAGSAENPLANVNGTLFLSANDGTHGAELWRSNGTAAGTVLVADINLGPGGSYPIGTNVNGTLFFAANDGVHGNELWQSNGTTAGTFLVRDILPGDLTNVNGTLFFIGNDGTGDELWRSKRSTVGAFPVASVSPNYLTNVNGTLFFSARDGGPDGVQLWVSNGSAAGTTRVTNINPSPYGFPPGCYPAGLTNVNGTLFFEATNGVQGHEIWESNGATAGTNLVADINPGPLGSYPKYLTNVNGMLFFQANDGTHGPDLWTLRPDTRAADTTTLTVSPAPSVYGQAVTFTVIVKANQAGLGVTPSGAVAFQEFATALGNAVLDASGKGTFSTTALATGMHTITAFYRGDHNFIPSDNSADPAVQTVNKGNPVTTLTVSSSTSVFGQALHFTAMVQAQAPGGGLPTGVVRFMDGSTFLGKAPLNSNQQAFFTISSFGVGSHTVTAVYDGDFNFNESAPSGAKVEAVSKASDSIALRSSLNPSTAGQAVTFTATVHATPPGIGVATGTVTFKDGTTMLGSGTLNGGVATFSTASLATGNHAITASYGGDADFTAGTSPAFGQVVHLTLAASLVEAGTSRAAISSDPSVPPRPRMWPVLDAARVDALFGSPSVRPRRHATRGTPWEVDWLGAVF